MNHRLVANVLGKVMLIEALLMIFPLFVGIYYRENTYLNYLLPMAGLTAAGTALSLIKIKDRSIYAKEGFVIVALAWIIMSLVGATCFVIGGEIPNYIDAFFETVSGFTTTGASILNNVETLSKSGMFWRLFTHWIGGMGVLVFVLAVIPASGSGAMHIFKAESPGPSSSKLVGKIRNTAQILYGIYVIMTLIETILLCAGGLNLYESLLNSFSTAGTGGFGTHNGSIAYYNSVYVEMVIAVFMFLFGVNFNVYYLFIIGNFSKAFRNREFLTYFAIVVVSTLIIAINILGMCADFSAALRYSFFQVTSISSTTGFATADFNTWPALSKGILLVLIVVGACGGSTGGGMKVSRVIVLCKSGAADIKRMINPRAVITVKNEGSALTSETEQNVRSYFILYMLFVVAVTLLVSLDAYSGGDILSNFSATLACIGNVGPGLNLVGPASSYAGYNWFSKLSLSFAMLAGRLELFPIIILFTPRTWRK